jgi:L-amino acid N-acyltransferase YncA
MQIRAADPDLDAAACAAIYAPFVAASATSFEEKPPDAAEFARRIERLSATHSFLIAEGERGVAGFAYGGPHRARPAYRWATEVSVYIDQRDQRRGMGRALYASLLPVLASRGYVTALAGITIPNPASVALHESLGFEPVGVYRQIGFKAGAWRDVGWWQKSLRAALQPPPDPV